MSQKHWLKRGKMKDPRTKKELDDFVSMKQASKYYQPRIITLDGIKRLRGK